MGYRSDVHIAFYLTKGTHDTPPTTDNPLLPFAALKLWFEETYPVEEAKGEWCAEVEYGDDHILLTYTDVKWYEGYDHPNKVSDAFALFSAAFRSDERDHRAQYEFVRIGEDDSDVERESSSYADHRSNVERRITFE
jgi:hypothetical protein